tara:strand:- start:45 stop:479 length:435 start_codon:yes stop_codon:yes gene_type:complete
MADKEKTQEEKKTGGPRMLRPGIGSLDKRKPKTMNRMAQAGRKREKTLGEKQYDTYVAELDSNFNKLKRLSKEMKGASPNIQAKTEKKYKKFLDSFGTGDFISDSRRDTAKVQNMAKGGRAGYRMGGKCKLAKRGKGRAYGKNS